MKSPSKFVLSCGAFGVLAAVGFQASTLKFGSVDSIGVYNRSDAAGRQQEIVKNLQQARGGLLEFINTYAMMRPEDAQRLKELTIKDPQTDADKNAAQGVRDAAIKAEARMRELQTKQNLTDAERTELTAYNNNRQANLGLLGRWEQDFVEELRGKIDAYRAESLVKVRQAVAQVGREGAYTIIFDQQVAPFAGTDVTAEALKAMNKIK